MADVAKAAGVSHQTVSRVLNESPAVRPATKQRVLQAVAELGYRPNRAARTLVTRSSNTIGVVTFGPKLYGPASTLMGVENAARDAGYYISLATMRTVDAQSVRSAVDHFIGQNVDGLIVVTTSIEGDETFSELSQEIPVVVVGAGRKPSGKEISVAIDQARGGRLAVEHLIGLGHEKIVHITGPEDSYDARARHEGYQEAIRAAGLEALPFVVGDWSAERGYEAGQELLARGSDMPTAVFASNDPMALGLIYALVERGVRVPRDVSVVGFDDVPGSAFYSPPLTTVRQDFEEMGRQCIESVLAALDGHIQRFPDPIAPELVERTSTAMR